MTTVRSSRDSRALARAIRLTALELCYRKKASHIGGAYSVTDIIAVLYADILRISPVEPQAPHRDRLFYSKGHACTALYAALAECDFFPRDELLAAFTADGSYFTSHVNHRVPGIELSTGSLGHALGIACGCALAAKRRGEPQRVFAIVSDGELDEGSNWEAILFAPQHRLDNLTLIVDYNKIQSFGRTADVLSLDPLAAKFRAFNWAVEEVDGHDHDLLREVFLRNSPAEGGRPSVVIAHTVKGKGVSFMEDRLAWHYKSPNETEYAQARQEIEVR